MLSTYITMEKALTAGVPARWSSTCLLYTSGRLPTGSPITEAPGRGRHGAGTGKRSWAGQRPPPWLPFFWQGAPTVPLSLIHI